MGLYNIKLFVIENIIYFLKKIINSINKELNVFTVCGNSA